MVTGNACQHRSGKPFSRNKLGEFDRLQISFLTESLLHPIDIAKHDGLERQWQWTKAITSRRGYANAAEYLSRLDRIYVCKSQQIKCTSVENR
jgi:hypothetical protein